MSWIRTNVGVIITILAFALAMAVQWGSFQHTVELALETDERLRSHEQDTTRHMDQRRDDQRWNDLMRRLDRIEDKLDER